MIKRDRVCAKPAYAERRYGVAKPAYAETLRRGKGEEQKMDRKMDLKQYIRTVPDFPKQGIMFRDITSILENHGCFESVIWDFVDEWGMRVDAIVALDARGFVFGSPMAYELGIPLILARKKGKLPGETVGVTYDLEYGTDTLEMRAGSLKPGAHVVVVDDLLATGGTAHAACTLVEKMGATVAGCAFVIELVGLGGREKLQKYEIQSLVTYEEKAGG